MIITPTLIVDDSLMITKIIKKALLANNLDGYHFEEQSIFTAFDGMEAFEVMGKNHAIKLIITDINMPNLNGDEFIEILQDTGKLENLDVVFITSSSKKLFLSPSIKEHILGVIYKPFNLDGFNEKLRLLQNNKVLVDIELKRIKEIQIEQKKHIEKACTAYLREVQLSNRRGILDGLINEIFSDDNISKEEYPEIVHSILSSYLFEIEHSHALNSKKILCILKSFEIKSNIRKNRFGLLDGFKSQITHVNSNELKLKEILNELTIPLLDKISIAFSSAKSFPKLRTQLFSVHFDYITKELIQIDCDFMDDILQKLLLEQNEILIFNKWLHNFLNNQELSTSVDAISKSPALKAEVTKRLSRAYQRSFLLSEHYCGQIEFYIWKRAKDSIEISNYLKNNMPKTLPISSRFLVHKKKISKEEHAVYLPFEKQTILVVSDNLTTLGVFKGIIDKPFDKWNFFCFANLSLIDAWVHTNIPNKIIIDYSFKSSIFKNGIQFLKLIIKKYPIFKDIIILHQVYIIADNKELSELLEHKKNYNFSIIQKPLTMNDIYENLLYK